MVARKLIDEVLALPAEDRLDLVHQLWDSIRDDAVHLSLSDEQKQELDRRYDEFLQEPTEGSTWEEVETFVQAKLRMSRRLVIRRKAKLNVAEASLWY